MKKRNKKNQYNSETRSLKESNITSKLHHESVSCILPIEVIILLHEGVI